MWSVNVCPKPGASSTRSLSDVLRAWGLGRTSKLSWLVMRVPLYATDENLGHVAGHKKAHSDPTRATVRY
ncbi:hypothetical protein Hesp01_55160 [Herbidospora sp. NBRC 101105]|nr:hypothetical protein Hesp01_55160 [Herbidospora sp. NBRC 101105]